VTVPNPHIFRAYDVRGVVEQDLVPEVVTALGRAHGSRIVRDGGRAVVVGRDVRTHSPRLAADLAAGLAGTGLTVVDVGVVPTPVLYFAVHHLDADGGVMVTGSHNPPEFNGFKLLAGKEAIHGDAIAGLRRRIEAGDYVEGEGRIRRQDVVPAYQAAVEERIREPGRRLKVVVDAGNGTAGPVAAPLYRALGHTVEELYCRPDGSFPHHHPDPSRRENVAPLAARVRQVGADLGLAYDGDSDRLGVVDHEGRTIAPDRLLAMLARPVLAEEPGAVVIGEVKCSEVLYEDVRRHGGVAVMERVGHSYIKAAMKARGAVLAGEVSGHLFFAHRWFGFDDAIYAGARLLELLGDSPRTLAQWDEDLPSTHVTPEIHVECPDAVKFEVVATVRERFAPDHDVVDIDGVRVRFEGGWGLVRASNTQPALILRAEADSEPRRDRIRSELEGAVEEAVASVRS